MVSLIDSLNTLSAFNIVIYGIDWAHKKFGLQSPTKSLISKQIIQAAKRIIGKTTTNRKLPLERLHVQLLQDKFVKGNLEQLQIFSLITPGFVAFLIGFLKKFICKSVHFSELYLFHKVVNTRSGFRFRDQKLSYSCFRAAEKSDDK